MRQVEVQGIQLYIHDWELLSNSIYEERGFYEVEILEYLKDNFKIHKDIMDIGANIGNHSVYFANFLECNSIIAFEPAPINFEILKVNVENIPKVKIENIAISDNYGFLKLMLDTENMGATRVHELSAGDGYLVECRPIDYYIDMVEDVTLLKIDVEFWEPKVLSGGKELIKKYRPLILIEDVYNEYGALLPDYQLIKFWSKYKTYLYGWR